MALRISTVALVCCHLLLTPRPLFAAGCEESSDCPEDLVCYDEECHAVPPACATFCQKMIPCIDTSGKICEGGVSAGIDGGGALDSWEYCDTYEIPVEEFLDECLSECAFSFDQPGDDGWMADLIECMTAAEYDCDAMDGCLEAIFEDYNYE